MDKIIYIDLLLDKPHLKYGRHLIVQVINPAGNQSLESFIEMMKIISKDFVNVIPADVYCGKLNAGGIFHKSSTIASYQLYVPFDWTLPQGWKVSNASEIRHEW